MWPLPCSNAFPIRMAIDTLSSIKDLMLRIILCIRCITMSGAMGQSITATYVAAWGLNVKHWANLGQDHHGAYIYAEVWGMLLVLTLRRPSPNPKHYIHTLMSHARLLQLVTTLPDPRATEYRGHTRAIFWLRRKRSKQSCGLISCMALVFTSVPLRPWSRSVRGQYKPGYTITHRHWRLWRQTCTLSFLNCDHAARTQWRTQTIHIHAPTGTGTQEYTTRFVLISLPVRDQKTSILRGEFVKMFQKVIQYQTRVTSVTFVRRKALK